MSTNRIGEALSSAGLFQQTTRALVEDNPSLMSGSPDDLIDRAISAILDRYHSRDAERKNRLSEFIGDFRGTGFHEIAATVAAEPQIGLATPGPHLHFAVAWMAYAAAQRLDRGEAVSTSDIDTFAFTCCTQLSQWAKAGYRLDWHQLDSEKKEASSSAPVGRWTTEWAKSS